MRLSMGSAVNEGRGLILLLHVFIMDLALFGLEVADLDAPHDLHSRSCKRHFLKFLHLWGHLQVLGCH